MLPDVSNFTLPTETPAPQAQVSAYAPPHPESSADRMARQIIQSRENGHGAPLQPMTMTRQLSERSARTPRAMPQQIAQQTLQSAPVAAGGVAEVRLPSRISAQCVSESATIYKINPMVLLAILKVESGGRTGIVSRNKNGTYDLGPAQFNTNSWGKTFQAKYNISRESLLNDMCQSVRAMAFAVRTEVNNAGGDLWRGIGNYNSRNSPFHEIYVGKVHNAHRRMIAKGTFE